MDTVQTTTARPHIVWLDVLRLVAILMVIAIHCTDPFNASPESRANPEFNFWGSVYGSMLRASVPLFVMMTGFLLLPVRQEASAFYKKRIPRVLFPFLIWSVLFDLAPWFIQWIGGSPELVTDFFPWEPNPSASFVEALKTIALIPVTFTVYATPMWYIYVLIGLYLYIPVFSAWVEKASDKAKRMFLAFWFISLFIPYLTEFAYSDFSDAPSFLADLDKYPNLIVFQTFSKAWGCAAIRLGMAFASKEIISIFSKIKYPYNVNLLTQKEAVMMLHRHYEVERWVKSLLEERTRLVNEFVELPCCEKIYPTDANFFLAKVTDAKKIYNYLVGKGIIVRNRTSISLCRDCLRVTIGTRPENDMLLEALKNYEC